jgi:hypothetical protein
MHRSCYMGTLLAFCAGVGLTLAAQAVRDKVTRAEEAWVQARMNGDKKSDSNLLADDFSWTFITGKVMNKQQTADNLGAAPNPEINKDIRVYQDAAVVVGTAKLTFAGKPITERFVRIWAKSGGVWRAVLFQATEVRQ